MACRYTGIHKNKQIKGRGVICFRDSCRGFLCKKFGRKEFDEIKVS